MAKTGSAPFSWSAFFTALASFSLFALLLGVVIALVVGLRPLEKRAAELSAKTPATIDIRWPEVPTTQRTNQRVTWVPQEEREQLVSLAQSAMGANADQFSMDALERVGKAMGASGWFTQPPTIRREVGGKIVVEGFWRVPAAVVRRDGMEQLISWEGKPMPLLKPAGQTNFPVIESPTLGAPKTSTGEVDHMTAWSGEDIAASLELLQVLLRQTWAKQVAGIDVTNFAKDRILIISTTYGTKVVWGGRVSKPALGEVSSAQKLAHMNQLFQQHQRIDAGYPMIYVNNNKLQFDISATADALAKAQELLASDVEGERATAQGGDRR